MGDKSESVTVGFKYFLGAHMGLVHGPVDSLLRVRVADRVVWVGDQQGSGELQIEQPEAFGGDGGEGGISGTFTFANGDPLQIQSTYLLGVLGTPLPAFRGVSCGIIEQMYVSSNNPYLKPWAFYMTRTDITTRGEEQWYVAKARIPTTCAFALLGAYSYDIMEEASPENSWTPPEGVTSVDILLVGEGGRGTGPTGTDEGGGGGAGGGGGRVMWVQNVPVSGSVLIQFLAKTNRGRPTIWDSGSAGEIVCEGGGNAIGRFDDDPLAWNGGGGVGSNNATQGTAPTWDGGSGAGGFAGGDGSAFYINLDNRAAMGGGGGGNSNSGSSGSAAGAVPGNGGHGVFFGTEDGGLTARLYTSPPASAEPMLPDGFGTPRGWFGGGGAGAGEFRDDGNNTDYFGTSGLGGGGASASGQFNAPSRTGAGGGGIAKVTLLANLGGSGFAAIFYRGESTSAGWDMNPAHIIRECLTDKEWGMGYNEADIDDVSFTAAADTLFDEEMGISILWQRENTIEAFVQDIVRHIDAALYVDRRTGKFVLKLIRSEATPTLTLGPNNIERVENYKRPAFGDLVNSVTVIYDDCDDGKTGAEVPQ